MSIEPFNQICWLALLLAVAMILANFLLAPLLRILGSARELAPVSKLGDPIKYSIVVPAYNEEDSIETKIETLRVAIESSGAECEVLIGSDGSKDGTVLRASAKLATFESVKWKVYEFVNEGKCSTLNKLVALANGSVVISTDADIPLPANAISEITNAFDENPRLGCVSCIPCFADLDVGSQRAYWNVEDEIRRGESGIGRLIVVTGMLYAYRKELFEPIPVGVMADDLWVPLNVLIRGHQSRQLDGLRVPYEQTDEAMEIVRRKRVIVGGMDVVRRLFPRLWAVPATLLLVTMHKVNRWALPVWLGIAVVASALIFPVLSIAYVCLAILLFGHLGKARFWRLAYAAASPILSFLEVIRKSDFSRWEHTRKN